MSFRKIQKIDPFSISNPDSGYVYLGQDNHGLWEKDEYGNVWYIQSGNTYITVIENATTSGTSGVNGTMGSSGKDGGAGTSGTSGKSGVSGTSGSSGDGTSGSSGTSGKSGSSGESGSSGKTGSSGTSGSSGVDGTSGSSGNGSSGINGVSGSSGIDGGYGASTRRWILDLVNTTPSSGNTYISATSNRLDFLNYIRIHKIDSDSELLSGWMDSWNIGILKIEDRRNLQIFGIYNVSSVSKIGNFYQINPVIMSASSDILSDGAELLISFCQGLSNINGTYYFDGTTLGTVSSMVIVNGVITSITLR